MSVTRDQILAATERPTMPALLPGLGEVKVRGMTGRERDQWERRIVDSKGKMRMANFRSTLIVACTVDESGNPMFSEADIPALKNLPAATLEPIVNLAMKLSGISEADAEELGKD